MMRKNFRFHAMLLATSLILSALPGCMTKINDPNGDDKGPGTGATGGVSSGADTSPRHGSAATSPERTGPS